MRRTFQLLMLATQAALAGAFAQEALPPATNTTPATASVVTSGARAAVTHPAPAPAIAPTNAQPDKVATAPAPPAPAPAAPPPPGSYEAFRLIAERNIFNPNRAPRSARPPPPTNETRRVPRVEAFALVGTMSYAKGSYAFFDSPSSQYRKSLKPGEAIAGYTLKDIAPSHVKLARERKAEDKVQTEELELKVGHQMRREDEGEWQIIVQAERFSSTPATATGNDTGRAGGGSSGSSRSRSRSDSGTGGPQPPPPPATSADGGGGASDLLRRLMEQRQKELNP
jgi:hypothetical protein